MGQHNEVSAMGNQRKPQQAREVKNISSLRMPIAGNH